MPPHLTFLSRALGNSSRDSGVLGHLRSARHSVRLQQLLWAPPNSCSQFRHPTALKPFRDDSYSTVKYSGTCVRCPEASRRLRRAGASDLSPTLSYGPLDLHPLYSAMTRTRFTASSHHTTLGYLHTQFQRHMASETRSRPTATWRPPAL